MTRTKTERFEALAGEVADTIECALRWPELYHYNAAEVQQMRRTARRMVAWAMEQRDE